MKRYIFLGLLALMAGTGFATGLDSLKFYFSPWTANPVESVMVTIDTSSSEYDTVYSTAGGYASFELPTNTETYIFRAIKAGYYKDSTHVRITALSANDTIMHDILWKLNPYKMRGGVVVVISADSTTDYVSGIQLDLVLGNDTLFSDTTDIKGTWPIPDDSLSIGTTYTLYATDPDSVYAAKHVTFTYDSVNTVVSLDLDSLFTATMNKLEFPIYSWRTGMPLSGVACEVMQETPTIREVGGVDVMFVGSTPDYYYSDQSGMVTIYTPDSTWVRVAVRSAGITDLKYYSVQDTTLSGIKARY